MKFRIGCSSLLLLAACQHSPSHVVAQQEQRFSDRAQQVGYQQAFVEFFSRDGIALQPHPLIVNEVFPLQPRDDNNLEWTPHYSFTSHAGDIGFTTGPWVYRDRNNSVVASGYFCSTWLFDGQQWRVALDGGGAAARELIRTPARAWQSDGKHRAESLPTTLHHVAVANDALWQLPNQAPQFSRDLPTELAHIELTIVREHVAAARDMATTLYEWREGNLAHYLHVAWRAEKGQWVLQFACKGGGPLL